MLWGSGGPHQPTCLVTSETMSWRKRKGGMLSSLSLSFGRLMMGSSICLVTEICRPQTFPSERGRETKYIDRSEMLLLARNRLRNKVTIM